MLLEFKHGIIGGGCAGMQMLFALLRHPETKNDEIIIFEQQQTIPNKCWCFWLPEDHIYKHLVEKSWQKITFRSDNQSITQNIFPYRYQYISSKKFYDFHWDLIRNHKNVRLIHTKPDQLKAKKDGFELQASGETYTIKNVYDSRPQISPETEKPLLQHFLGRHVTCEKDLFTDLSPSIMDFDVSGDGFIYLLPFDANHALIELTYFSDTFYEQDHYQRILDQFLADRYPQQSIKTTAEESGKIPMSGKNFIGFGEAGQWLIGTAGGITKATTGYTFSRITVDCKKIVEYVASSSKQKMKRGTTGRFLFYDRLLLGILKQNPKMLQPIMSQLFTKQPFKRVLKFLDEDSSVFEEIQIFGSLPWKPFLKQLLNYRRLL